MSRANQRLVRTIPLRERISPGRVNQPIAIVVRLLVFVLLYCFNQVSCYFWMGSRYVHPFLWVFLQIKHHRLHPIVFYILVEQNNIESHSMYKDITRTIAKNEFHQPYKVLKNSWEKSLI